MAGSPGPAIGASAAPAAAAETPNGQRYFGLLRVRDLTFFSLLHLDMRPAHAIAASPGGWGVEASLGYQNTWSLSPKVEEYLIGLSGRRELGAAEVAAIRALPGDNYLIDAEVGLVDITGHLKLSDHWGVYATLSAVSYNGGFGDGTIERFHDRFGFSSFGRPAVARNRVNLILDLRGAERVVLEKPTDGGLLDPTIGLRYAGFAMPDRWNLVVEAAVKLPLGGRRAFLSTGDVEPGVQATLQYFGAHHALYFSAAAVRYGDDPLLPASRHRIVPTAVVGYERRLSDRTHLMLQGYASRPAGSRSEVDVAELTRTKFQLSLGVYRLVGDALVSAALTENLQNLNNTPDIGLQLGWAYSPALRP
jgi:hypothetical protein